MVIERKSGLRRDGRILAAGAFLSALLAAGCSGHPSDQQVQQQAAQTTQQVKQGAQQAADAARVAAANAEDKINAVAAGVKQGLQGGQPASVLDLNSATRDQLATLPGISPARAPIQLAKRPGGPECADPAAVRPDFGQSHRPSPRVLSLLGAAEHPNLT